jgi:hypothetical protein
VRLTHAFDEGVTGAVSTEWSTRDDPTRRLPVKPRTQNNMSVGTDTVRIAVDGDHIITTGSAFTLVRTSDLRQLEEAKTKLEEELRQSKTERAQLDVLIIKLAADIAAADRRHTETESFMCERLDQVNALKRQLEIAKEVQFDGLWAKIQESPDFAVQLAAGIRNGRNVTIHAIPTFNSPKFIMNSVVRAALGFRSFNYSTVLNDGYIVSYDEVASHLIRELGGVKLLMAAPEAAKNPPESK